MNLKYINAAGVFTFNGNPVDLCCFKLVRGISFPINIYYYGVSGRFVSL